LTQAIGAVTDSAAAARCKHRAMTSETQIVELADRRSEDVDVSLFWARHSGHLWVNVTHRRTARTARIAATPANALDVFNHPFAYAREVA
jgi:hypothetical protein